MTKRYILYEHASGYAIFRIIAHEEVGVLIEEVQKSVCELDRFGKVTKLYSYYPFTSSSSSLDNGVAIADGHVTEELKIFLQSCIKASSKITLGVTDPKLANTIHDITGINCVCNDVVNEITRGIRTHFCKMIESLNSKIAINAQLGLGHSLSRHKIKFNAKKADNMIIQSSAMVEQLDKDINLFSQRVREWYSFHFPELYNFVKDNQKFIQSVSIVGNRKSFDENKLKDLSELLDSNDKAFKIYELAKSSIGVDLADIDLINIEMFCQRLLSLMEYRSQLSQYLEGKMKSIAPNLSAVVGESIGARLISQAGSLINLAKCPASTIQILGAEKSLFRALKTKGKTPKYGILFHSSFIGRTPVKYRGRISRLLSHKCAIASRLDIFSEQPCNIIGKKMSDQIEERLDYYKNGEPEDAIPRLNAEVMSEALRELALYREKNALVRKSKKKKNRSSLVAAENNTI